MRKVLWMKPIYACLEHIEEALDDAVYGGFQVPVMEQFKPVDNKIINVITANVNPYIWW